VIQEQLNIQSILALDCGSTVTRAILIDYVEQEYRLVARSEAPSTVEAPWSNIAASVRHALTELSSVTGRQFLDEQGQIISPEHQGSGVDIVVATTSAGSPLRLVLAGAMWDVSLTSARHALSGSYAVVQGTVSLDRREGGTHKTNDDIGGQIGMIHDLEPDAVVIVGGVDGGASKPVLQVAEAVALACAVLPDNVRPTVIYAGNKELRSEVAQLIGAGAELRAVDNVMPSPGVENRGPLEIEIDELYRQTKMERLPGFGTLASWSPVQVVPTAKALAHTVQYLARLDGINVLGVDVGGTTTSVATVVDEQADLVVRSDLGLSYNAAQILESVPVESILRWLPFEMKAADVRNELHNKALRHGTLPQTRQDLFLEQAVARELVRLALADFGSRWPKGASLIYSDLVPKFHLVIGAGGVLVKAAHYGQAALILLDAVQPLGVCGLALDNVGLLAPLGAVAMVSADAAAQVVERDALLNLGTVVAPVGAGREGEVALTFRIEYEDGRSLEVEVPYGSLEVIPLPAGQTANLELRPTRRFDVGLGTKGRAGKTKVQGGLIGIIIDARGRPLPIASEPAVQRERMQRWLWDMGS
jgi:uncharacterized protein (TIGR01319 family)